jgi:integrase
MREQHAIGQELTEPCLRPSVHNAADDRSTICGGGDAETIVSSLGQAIVSSSRSWTKTRAGIPCHHQTREYLRDYIALAGFEPRAKVPLFQTAPGRTGVFSGEPMSIDDALRAVKRRCKAAGLPSSISNHSFRATGITLHQENGGRLEDAQTLAGHADARTRRLYVRKERKVAQAEVERVQL